MTRRFFLALLMSYFALFASASNYLTFTAEVNYSSFCIKDYGNNNANVEYSLDDGETWTLLEKDIDGNNTVKLTKGDRVLLRGDNPNGFSKEEGKYSYFEMIGAIAASGSVMSLIDGIGESKTIPSKFCFCYLFYNCGSLTKAPELPATELTESCYKSMFASCGNLTIAPELPATVLASNCYEKMFAKSGIKKAPALPATELAISCYEAMFVSCYRLTEAPELPATELTESCYNSMFASCEKLTIAPKLPATVLASNCYGSMFDGSGLTQAPELPATELAETCYELMFARTELTQAPELPAMDLTTGCYMSMFYSCKLLTKAPELPAMDLATFCYMSMFRECKNLTEAPELPAEVLTDDCYYEMFKDCEEIQKIKVSFTDWGATFDTFFWVENVAPTGTFYCPKGLPLEYGEDRIPEGWNVKYIDEGTDVAEHVSDASFKAWAANGKITYTGATMPVEIYDINGRLVKKMNEKSQSVDVPQHGIYVVKSGNVSLKVEL